MSGKKPSQRDDDDEKDWSSGGVRARRAAVLQLLSHLYFTRRLWFSVWISKAGTAKDLNENPPRVPLSQILPPPWLESVAGWTYLASLLAQLLLVSGFISDTNRSATVSAWMATIAFSVVATFDCAHLQPPVLTGLALILCNDPTAQRVVLAGTWLWSGLHKVNPGFLNKEHHTLIDPVYSLVLGSSFVKRNRILLRLLTAMTEAAAGGLLLIACGQTLPRRCRRNLLILTRVSVLFLVSMHAVIIVRLMQTRWNYHVLGWNVSCLYLALVLWRHCWGRRYPHKNGDGAEQRKIRRLVLLTYIIVFTIAPATVTFGYLDPYLGNSNYSNNVPSLEMELPVGGGVAAAATHYEIPVYQKWGLIDESFIPAMSHDGRQIVRMDYLTFHIKAKGTVGYPSVWAHKQFARDLCDKLRAANLATDDARFFLSLPYTGWTLWESLWATASFTTQTPPLPPLFVQKKCSNEWRPFQSRLKQGVGSLMERDTGISATFSTTLQESHPPVQLFWVDTRLSVLQTDGTVTTVTLLQQGQLGSVNIAPKHIQTFVGHMFVAARDINHQGGLCCLVVWIALPNESTDGVSQQHFVLGKEMMNSTHIALPGMKACEGLAAETEANAPRRFSDETRHVVANDEL